MKLKKLFSAMSAGALAMMVSAPASALIVLDGWQLDTPSMVNQTNIGHLNLTGGGASIIQEVNGSGDVFVGARFSEGGLILSGSFTPENVVGLGDFGGLTNFPAPEVLTITFTNVFGVVSEVFAGGGFRYSFGGGDFLVSGNSGNYLQGVIIGIGGVGAATNVVGGVAGSSNLLVRTTAILNPGFVVSDSSGNDLAAGLLSGNYLFQALTDNTVTGSKGTALCYNDTATCANFSVRSSGELDVLKVPEPGSMALVGLGLLAAGVIRRKSKKA